MKYSIPMKPISYLKSHASDMVKEVCESREPLLITQNGEAKLIVMDVRTYEENEQTLALLKILALGQKEIERGQFQSAKEVFSEIDLADGQ